MKKEQIVNILLRAVSEGESRLTEEEFEQLKRWLARDSANADVYARLTDRQRLEPEYLKWRALNITRPMEDMQRRIGSEKATGRRKAFQTASYAFGCLAVAASILLFIMRKPTPAQSPSVQYQPVDYIASIKPGSTKAILTHPDSTTVSFYADSMQEDAYSPSKKSGVKKSTHISDDVEKIAMNCLAIPRGGEFHIVLEDSTEVWLNAESSLEYPDNFDSVSRKVAVSGEAYFKVHKEADRPFMVDVDGQVIRVYGTEFGVNSYADDGFVYTTLVSGKVGILPNENSTSVLYLSPDHQAVFSKADATTVVNDVDAKVVTSWKDGLFVFEDQSLAQIMVQLSRWYDFEYRFADTEVASIKFSGRTPRYGNFADLLSILEKSGGITFSAEDNCIVISKQ